MDLIKREELFKKPTNAFRGKPFWSWNGKLDKEELLRQIDVIKEMGFGGFFMHSRTGLETEYLGDEWFDLINSCTDYGTKENMESWLYDEDRWPSGSAGGLVTKEEKYRAKYIAAETYRYSECSEIIWDDKIAAVFLLDLKDGVFHEKKRVDEEVLQALIKKHKASIENNESKEDGENREIIEDAEQTIVVFRIGMDKNNDNYNGYTYVDTMNKEAIEKYIAITHEEYKKRCGERIGNEIKGIFTDEPHRGSCFTDFSSDKGLVIPYTFDLFSEFVKRFGYDLAENLPEVFYSKDGDIVSKATRDYFELTQELFVERFAMPIHRWCKENNMLFTGHVLQEDSLSSQAVMQGSMMRFYEHMDCPGIDVLSAHNTNYWIAKQLSSVGRQLGQKYLLSELYGCTGWQMDFNEYKKVGDWQALLGINLRCPHLSWYTMKGEAKRDYPASIFHQSPWYKEFSYVEDYFSRINVALAEGTPECELLVLHPIESVWAMAYQGAFSGLEAADKNIQEVEKHFRDTFHYLSENQIDFDYGDEEILAGNAVVKEKEMQVGQAVYRRILVTGMVTMRKSTLELLRKFKEHGGEVIFAGDVPKYIDAQPSDETEAFAKTATVVPFEESELSNACRSGKEVTFSAESKGAIYVQSKQCIGGRIIMLLNTDSDKEFQDLKVNLGKGTALELWNARTGEITLPIYHIENGTVETLIDLEAGGERIFFIPSAGERNHSLPTDGTQIEKVDTPLSADNSQSGKIVLPDSFAYSLSEDNICVLDYVDVTAEGEKLLSHQEVLKADRSLRGLLGIPVRSGEMIQPWYEKKFLGKQHNEQKNITLDYHFKIEVIPKKIQLVVESLEEIDEISVNGEAVSMSSTGKWIDICFDKIAIFPNILHEGVNKVTIKMAYRRLSGIEAIYLLGDFGVDISEDMEAVIGALPNRLRMGDITSHGLPFYSGSVTYSFDKIPGTADVTIPSFGGSVVKLHGKEEEMVAFRPYSAVVQDLYEIEVVLTRRNTFGPLHERNKFADAYGPGNFVTEGDDWTDNYQLYEQGLLELPVIYKVEGN